MITSRFEANSTVHHLTSANSRHRDTADQFSGTIGYSSRYNHKLPFKYLYCGYYYQIHGYTQNPREPPFNVRVLAHNCCHPTPMQSSLLEHFSKPRPENLVFLRKRPRQCYIAIKAVATGYESREALPRHTARSLTFLNYHV
ncbi:hypothetical protein AFLA_001491 [Aspergillus flavus NRRL3357]|nr:hypothetical protein AFLA_001491 [Aspergillus flavus NRRL3357]